MTGKRNRDSREEPFLYELKPSLVTETERQFLLCIEEVLPEGYLVVPQANLAAFLTRTDEARFRNELFRNVDFLITDFEYAPAFIIEINDKTHLSEARRERDKKVADICEEAGIPIITLWTSYGVNPEYIRKRIEETIDSLPIERIHHFEPVQAEPTQQKGCYIATCVYGSYDCPQVWTLRRYRDTVLEKTWLGRLFIRGYYAVSPVLVRHFGKNADFQRFFRGYLNRLVCQLKDNGFADTPYRD